MSVDGSQAWLEAQGDDAFLLFRALRAHGWRENAPASVGVAVSGGSDSMAMLHLMARAALQAGWSLRAVTVDHRLRPEAAEEAAFVARACTGLGVGHEVLAWDHGEITGNLMERAREARYRLIADWARVQGIEAVMVAHTADDQAETFLMGLSREAGLDGLVGMRPEWEVDGVTFRRPFLSQTREELRAFLVRNGLGWVEDPTNENNRYTRVKARRALKALKPLGITVDRLSSVIHHLSMAQGVVRQAVAEAGAEILTEVAGSLLFDHRPFMMCDPEIQRRLVIAMVRWIGGQEHPLRESKVFALGLALQKQKDATLGGVRFRWQGETCTVSREARAMGGPVAEGAIWDGRWRVAGADGEVRALGAAGLRQCPDWRSAGLPRQMLEVTPAIWQGKVIVAAPMAGFGTAKAACVISFNAFLLSH